MADEEEALEAGYLRLAEDRQTDDAELRAIRDRALRRHEDD